MKKTMLWGALFTIICAQVQAEITQQPSQPQAAPDASVPVANPPAPVQVLPSTQPAQTQPTYQQTPENAQNVQPTTAVQPTVAPVINCDYKIPTGTKNIEQSLVLTWAEKATTQAFDFDPVSVDNQVEKLKSCFTEQGWSGFQSALEKSGNVEAIKSQKLTVSSQLDGQTQLTEAKDNQWKLVLPLHVVYQNDKEKVTQLLNVNVTVTRKINGDLGIVQMIATPRPAVGAQQPTDPSAAPAMPSQPAIENSSTATTPENSGTPPATTDNPVPSNGPASTNNPGMPQ